MKKLLFLLVLSCCIPLNAQETSEMITITGKVVEKDTAIPLEFATVTLLNAAENKIVWSVITNPSGHFEVKIPKGNYSLKVEFNGLKNITLEHLELKSTQTFPAFELEQQASELETVEVKVEKSTIEHRLDKKVFNVGNDLVSKGGTANDILNNVPSVNVNNNGVVSLRGNTGVRILINGKPSVLTNNNGLEQIAAESIEKVEVITNPSSKYDAEGRAGIINIVLKKNKLKGFSSAIQLTGGIPDNHALGYNANYKNKKINFFSDMRYRYINFLGTEESTRTNFENNNTIDSYLLGTVDRDRTNKTFSLYFGGDYYLNEKNTLTLSYFYRNNLSRNKVDYQFFYLDENQNPQRTVSAFESYREPQVSNQIELNYIKTFAQEGKKITVNLQYDFWNDDENEAITEQEIFPATLPITTLKSNDIESSKDFLFQADYMLPLGKESKLEIGTKGEIRRIDSDYEAFQDNTRIDSLTNVLKYSERIIGLYIQYGSSIKKLNYLIGLRTENAATGSDDRANQFKIDKKYTNLFPALHLTYEINSLVNLQLSYSKRIQRPAFWQLNPFGGIADRRNIRIGNPDLNPVYTDSYEFGAIVKWKKFTFNPGVYHQYSKNTFEDIRLNNPNGILVEQAINSGTESRLGGELSISYSPLKWLTCNGEMNYYKFEQKGVFNVADVNFTSKQSVRIKHETWNFQANSNYQGGSKSGQTDNQSVLWLDLGIGKDIWKEKATVTLKADNVFDSRINKGTVTGTDYVLNYNFRTVGPRVYATFIYRLNRTKTDRDRMPD